jgi:hypothetical protein
MSTPPSWSTPGQQLYIERMNVLNAELLDALSDMLLAFDTERSMACKKARKAIQKATDDFDYWSNQ